MCDPNSDDFQTVVALSKSVKDKALSRALRIIVRAHDIPAAIKDVLLTAAERMLDAYEATIGRRYH
jgi:hypothetical protein